MKAPSSQPAHDLASTGTPEPVDGFAYFMVPDGSDAFSFTGNGISQGPEGAFGPVDGSVDLAGGSTLTDASQFVPDAQVSGDFFDHMPAASIPLDPAAPSGAQPGIVIALNSNPGDVSDGGVLSVNDTPIFGSLFPGHSAADLFSTLANPITGDLPDQSAVGSPVTNPTAGNLTSQSTAWSAATSAELNSSTSFSGEPGTLANQPNCAPNYLAFDAPLHVGSTQSQTVPSGLSSFGQPSNNLTTGAAPDFGPALSNNSSGPALSAADAPDFLDVVGGQVAQAASAAMGLGAAAASGSSQIVTLVGSGLVFDNTFDSGVSATFQSEIVAAENYLQSQFSNNCTVNVTFDLESINPDYSGENFFNPIVVSYSAFVSALEAHAATPTEEAAVAALASLPDPSDGAGFEVSIGEARILGLAGPGSGNDATIILNSVYWTASALQSDPGDVEAVLEHELSEGIMGRIGSLGIADAPYWAPMDLFRYTASGQRDFTGGEDGKPTYFSVNGSNVYTGLQYHNSVNSSGQFDGEDLADWDAVGADANAHDPFGPGGPGAGDPGTLSATDIAIMEALGWNPSTTYVWGTGTNGSFATAANWSPGIVPTSGIDVVLIGTGNYTVTSSISETVNSLSMAAGTTFNITGGTFTVNGSGGTGIDAGTIKVQSGATSVGIFVSSGGYEYVEAGGTANTTTVNSGGFEVVYGTSTGTSASGGGYEYVEAGGTANTTTLNSGGIEVVYGTSAGTSASGGGYEYVEAGGTANTTTLNSGGYEVVYGTSAGTSVDSGGQEYIEAGGTANTTTVNSGGYEYVEVGGTANTTTLNSGGYEIDYGTSAGTIVNSGGYEYVEAGGTANTTTVNSGGIEFVYGTSAGTIVGSGGYEYVEAGGTANTTTLNSGGIEVVYGTSAGTSASGGGYEYVEAGGTANTTTLNSGGYEVVYGTSAGTIVGSGGYEYVEAGGTANTTTLNSGGYEYVEAGGTANTTTLNSGGYEVVYGTSAGTIVGSGGYEYVEAGGTANTTTLNSGGIEYVEAGGTANTTTLNSGGYEYVEAGGTANTTTLNSGGIEVVYGTSAGTIVGSGGYEYVEAGGTANTTTLNSGGYEYVEAGGTANTTTLNSGSFEVVYGTSTGTSASGGGYEYVEAGGTANTTTLNSGGFEVVYGTSAGTIVGSGGYEYVEAGGTANTTTLNSGGYEYVEAGGTANTTTLNSGGFEVVYGTSTGTSASGGGYEYVEAGGTANTTTLNSGGIEVVYGTSAGTSASGGGYEYVEAGGTANTTTLNSGGYEYVEAGGTANTTTLNSGGIEVVYGTSTGTIVNSGGYEYVEGGTANTTTVNSGGYEYVEAGGTANTTTLNSGGIQYDYGTASGAAVNTGGFQYVEAGGTASGTTLAGGTVVVLSGGAATGTFTFSGGGLLVLNDFNYSSLQLAGFTASTDKIDFTGISFSGSTQFTFNTTTDLLTITDGAHTATITIDGQHTQESFTISSDGKGGTIITDPALIADGVDSFNNTSGLLTIADGTHTAMITTDGQHTQQSFTTSPDGSGSTIGGNPLLSADNSVGSFSKTSDLLTYTDGTHTVAITTDGQNTQQNLTMSSDGGGGVADPLLSAGTSVGSSNNTSGLPTIADATHTAPITTDGQNTLQSGFTLSSDGSGNTNVINPLLSADGNGDSFTNTGGPSTNTDGAHTATIATDGQNTQQGFAMSFDGDSGTNVTDSLLSADSSLDSFSSGAATAAATPVVTSVASSAPPADHGAAATAGLAALGNPQNDTFVFNTHLGSNSMTAPQSLLGSETMPHVATFDSTQASHAPSFGPTAMAEHVSFDFGTHDANSGATVPLPDPHPVDLYTHPLLIG